MQRTFGFIVCMVIICCVGAEDAILQELTDKQVKNLLTFCYRTDKFYTLTAKPLWTPFNEDAEQCRARVLERKCLGIYFETNSFGSHKVHSNLLFGCNGSDEIHSLNLATMKSNTVNDSTCPGKVYAVIYIDDKDYESMEVIGKKFGTSYYNKSTGVLDMETLQAIEETCYSHPQVIPSTPQEMRQNHYNWVGCVNQAVDMNIGNFSEKYPDGCALAVNARISQSHLTMDFTIFFSLNEIKKVTAQVLQKKEQWLVSANQSACSNKDQTSTTVEPTSSENPESKTSDMGWVHITILITIIVLVCVIVVYLAIIYIRGHCVALRNMGISNSLEEEQNLRQSTTVSAENLENGYGRA